MYHSDWNRPIRPGSASTEPIWRRVTGPASRQAGCRRVGPRRRRLFQWSWYGALRLGYELRLVPTHENRPDHDDDRCRDADHDDQRAGEALDLMAQHVGGKTEYRRPGKGADNVGQNESRPG